MAIYAIHYTYPDDTTELFRVRPAHREWLSGLPGLLVAGMYQAARDEMPEGDATSNEPDNGALIVVAAESLDEVTAAFDHDPYWVSGLIVRRVVREWNPPLGPWVADATQSPA